mgnify:CR=1 FL=1
MRQMPVVAELLNRRHEVVLITGENQAIISRQYLGNSVNVQICDTDAGLIVKPGTILLDENATTVRVKEHVTKWPELIATAPDADVYVVDICPWALIAAREKEIPSFLMASFTWVEQYEAFLPEELLKKYKDAFSLADHVLYYDLANEPTRGLLGDGKEVGFVARPFTDAVDKLRCKHNRETVFLSLGGSNSGLDFDIDVSELPYDFITTSALKLIGDNVEYLSMDVQNTQDYIAAADYCIAKAGWSTVSELMISGNRFALINRPDVPEDTMIISQIENRNAGISINTEDLQDVGSVIDRIKRYPKSNLRYGNNYKKVTNLIAGNLGE